MEPNESPLWTLVKIGAVRGGKALQRIRTVHWFVLAIFCAIGGFLSWHVREDVVRKAIDALHQADHKDGATIGFGTGGLNTADGSMQRFMAERSPSAQRWTVATIILTQGAIGCFVMSIVTFLINTLLRLFIFIKKKSQQ